LRHSVVYSFKNQVRTWTATDHCHLSDSSSMRLSSAVDSY